MDLIINVTESVKIKKKKQEVLKEVPKSAPRRQGQGYRRRDAVKDNQMITPWRELENAPGALSVINVNVIIDNTSFQFIPVGIVSLALTRGSLDPYAIYQLIYSDIASIANAGNGTAPVRLEFANEIYGALSPKTVPFRQDASLSFLLNGINSIIPSSELTTDGGFNYYMYIPSGTETSGWATQVAPGPYNSDEVVNAYLSAMQNLAGKELNRTEIRNVALDKRYLKDASAFTRNSPYYGQGAGVGAPYSSWELEVPCQAPMLGTLCAFDRNTPRASRCLGFVTGDSCSNYSIGALKCFPTNFYRGAIPPIYKFLDIDEFICALGYTWVDAVTKAVSNPGLSPDDIAFLRGGVGCSWSEFRIMVRQQLLWMFADSQNLGQFLCPEVTSGGFQSFLCGSNCFPHNPSVILSIPSALNENMRMLKLATRLYYTKKFQSPNNHITHVPVWGAFRNTSPVNFTFFDDLGGHDLFLAEPSSVPNIWDGTFGNTVADFNNTQILSGTVAIWNDIMKLVQPMIAGLTYLGGDGNGSPLLQYTRYVTFKVQDDKEVQSNVRIPRNYKPYIVEKEIDVYNEKRKSEKPTKLKKRFFNPPNSTTFNEFTVSYSGMLPITATHKEFFPMLILPVIELVPVALPGQQQVQTATLEPYVLATGNDNLFFNSRNTEIFDATPNYVTGLAGHKTEFASFVEALSKSNSGGFLGDLFSTVGNIANTIGL